ncbi:hypothetical protein Q9S71_05615 [Microbacterium sp. KSW4-11]|uniref:Uncharacterized protein n=1 Tax=Microbacterium gawkjiense TaxID=3067309 RepID=A0ABU3G9Z9_9MICO|nr:hypothetical protein [Microbacterium sp. KSW4-11]MDT3316296.1 hypothetical protein [Microbacterium sp. KSW4-11]
MGRPVDEELSTLRARAYGPAADIHLDPAAQQRLAELEDATRPVRDEVDVEADIAPKAAADEADAAAAVTSTTRPPAVVEAARTFWERPRVRLAVWVASVAVAGVVGAGVTYGAVAFAPVPTSDGVAQIDTLRPSTTAQIPTGFLGYEEGASVYEYRGLTMFPLSYSYMYGAADGEEVPDRCFQVIQTALIPSVEEFDPDSWGYEGNSWGGCSLGSFRATAAIPLTGRGAPDVDLPEGRAIQFVLDGDRIGVYLDRG